MPLFRKKTPKRRSVTGTVWHYSVHREILQKDFDHRCGYCDSHDSFRHAHYEIDHFIPKKTLKEVFPIPEEYKIKEQEYSNLVYSCQSCNNAKGDQWPIESIDIHHKNDIGFIDPCNSKYDDQFKRDQNGEIKYKTELGKWMYKALKLWKPEHSIRWHLDELDQVLDEIEMLMPSKDSKEKKEFDQKHYSVLLNHRKYYSQLKDYLSHAK